MNTNSMGVLILAIVLAIVAFFAMQKADRFLELIAVHDCASDYKMEFTDGATKLVRPLEDPFKECLWNKGVKSFHGTTQ